ncbi:hypothetical protein AHAS_Ahas06G0202200 [Arachis hypogaea]
MIVFHLVLVSIQDIKLELRHLFQIQRITRLVINKKRLELPKLKLSHNKLRRKRIARQGAIKSSNDDRDRLCTARSGEAAMERREPIMITHAEKRREAETTHIRGDERGRDNRRTRQGERQRCSDGAPRTAFFNGGLGLDGTVRAA